MKKFSIFNFQFSFIKSCACRQKGFTLIELLIVIVIIGGLASFLMTNYIGVRMRSRDAQRKADLRQIQSALELYRYDQGEYPNSLTCNSSFVSPDNAVTYMQKVPCDPINTESLVYKYQPALSNMAYTIGACLENVNDQQRDPGVSPNIAAIDGGSTITDCVGGNTNWSYTLYSP